MNCAATQHYGHNKHRPISSPLFSLVTELTETGLNWKTHECESTGAIGICGSHIERRRDEVRNMKGKDRLQFDVNASGRICT